ncbi:MAG: hypothetical protein HY661_10960 [Betaproteobacteria bacterium]|nr:hypothetical protein [Betaproteobacteria bacterium]
MKTVIRVLDSSGDSVHTFDLREKEAQRQAKALIERLQMQGATLFSVDPKTGEGAKKVTGLAELGEENVAVPRIVGG